MQAGTTPIFKVVGMTGPVVNKEKMGVRTLMVNEPQTWDSLFLSSIGDTKDIKDRQQEAGSALRYQTLFCSY